MKWSPVNALIQCAIFLVILPGTLFSQQAGRINADSLFLEARDLATAGNYSASREACYQLVSLYPSYLDGYLLLARTHAWEEHSDSARYWVNRALLLNPGHEEALYTLAQVEYWAGTPAAALPAVREGLALQPGDPDLLYLQALILTRAEDWKEARKTLALLRDTLPAYPGADSLARLSRAVIFPSAVSAEYFYDHFSLPYVRNWHVLALSLDAETRKSKGSLRLNTGYLVQPENAFGENLESQLEADWYPWLGPKNYMYLNYGISPGLYFPAHRAGAEIFQDLPAAFVLSAGFRYLKWTDGFLFYTASLEKYAGPYWISLRPYIFHKPYGWSAAWFLTLRRYLGHPEDYLQLIAGTGTSPDEPLLAASDLDRLSSRSIRLGGQYRVSDRWRVHVLAGFAREEYASDQNRNRFDFRAGLSYLINPKTP